MESEWEALARVAVENKKEIRIEDVGLGTVWEIQEEGRRGGSEVEEMQNDGRAELAEGGVNASELADGGEGESLHDDAPKVCRQHA